MFAKLLARFAKPLTVAEQEQQLLATKVPFSLETLKREVRTARRDNANEMAYRGAVARLVKEATPNKTRVDRELIQALLIATVA